MQERQRTWTKQHSTRLSIPRKQNSLSKPLRQRWGCWYGGGGRDGRSSPSPSPSRDDCSGRVCRSRIRLGPGTAATTTGTAQTALLEDAIHNLEELLTRMGMSSFGDVPRDVSDDAMRCAQQPSRSRHMILISTRTMGE